jgi:hypothetical protein
MRTCRIGQTERGSYVATIIAPVPPELTPSLFSGLADEGSMAMEPYERRVTLQLMAALQVIHGAIQTGKPKQILEGVGRGVSANLCEALASMGPTSPQGRLEIAMSWARNRPRVPRALPQKVSFAQGEFVIIREAGRRLREDVGPRRERIEGAIISLQAEPRQLFGAFEGRVIVRAEVEGRWARIRFLLGQEEYVRACNAHRDRHRVAVTGILHRDASMKVFELSQPQGFEVLPDQLPPPSTPADKAE